MCTDLTVTNLRFSFTRRYISQILFFPPPLLPDSLSLPAPLLAAFARPSSLPAHNLAALCSLLSHTKRPGTALGRSPPQFFVGASHCSAGSLHLQGCPHAASPPSSPQDADRQVWPACALCIYICQNAVMPRQWLGPCICMVAQTIQPSPACPGCHLV